VLISISIMALSVAHMLILTLKNIRHMVKNKSSNQEFD
jgi:hypothetical protein